MNEKQEEAPDYIVHKVQGRRAVSDETQVIGTADDIGNGFAICETQDGTFILQPTMEDLEQMRRELKQVEEYCLSNKTGPDTAFRLKDQL